MAMTNTLLRSPWVEQLEETRAINQLPGTSNTDIAIIGAGISGITTAYFLLKRTRKKIAIIEANRVAHGATGHNAGQLVSYFERPFSDIVHEFGLDMAADGQRAVESAWDLLKVIRHDLHLTVPCEIFTGYAGCADLEALVHHLQNNEKRVEAGLSVEKALIAKSWKDWDHVPRSLRKLCKTVPDEKISELLQTKDHRYIAVLSSKKGCMNSARFCEEVLTSLLKRYSKRLLLAEKSPISTITLHKEHAELIAGDHRITASRVILCTNGFERMRIENRLGSDIDTKFHHLVRGSVGYMAAFIEEPKIAPTAISYLPTQPINAAGAYDSEPYFYLTRRPHGTKSDKSLICIGGPEALMDDTNNYSKEHPYPDEARSMIDRFVRRTYRHSGKRLKYTHLWHGLMGYTPNGLRCVGEEPCNRVLLYNLGCNGVGILPSIYGGFRISQIIKGEKLKPSIFDPADSRCFLPQKKTSSLMKTLRTKATWHAVAAVAALAILASVILF